MDNEVRMWYVLLDTSDYNSVTYVSSELQTLKGENSLASTVFWFQYTLIGQKLISYEIG